MSLLLLLGVCLLTCLGQIAQKLAVDRGPGDTAGLVERLRSPWLLLALASLGLALLLWLLVLQRLDVGIAYPMLSLNFVLLTLVARFGFGEAIDARHWLGLALLVAGVILLGRQT